VARITAFIGALAIALALIIAPTAASAGVFVGIGVSINVAPPPLPVYVQPPVLGADEIWTPGYWAYGAYGYYWVPGTWVAAPQPGYLWTPGYWAYTGGTYGWQPGYWGPHVGFYGGVNYGFGYTGVGYVGGGWVGGHFTYNAAVTNVNRTVITNVYVDRTVVNDDHTYNANTRVSFNGGPDGIQARPTADEAAYRSEAHLPPTAEQRQHTAPIRDGSSAFSRFDQDRGADAPAHADRPADSYRPEGTPHPANAYHAPHAPHAPAEHEHAPPAHEHEHDR
jgi:hypothetical protein